MPVFRPETNQPFTKRSMVLAVFNSILPGIPMQTFHNLVSASIKLPHLHESPVSVNRKWVPGVFKCVKLPQQPSVDVCVAGIMLLLLCFFAFLHCWLNLFAELLQFADRMFYKVRGLGVDTLSCITGDHLLIPCDGHLLLPGTTVPISVNTTLIQWHR